MRPGSRARAHCASIMERQANRRAAIQICLPGEPFRELMLANYTADRLLYRRQISMLKPLP